MQYLQTNSEGQREIKNLLPLAIGSKPQLNNDC